MKDWTEKDCVSNSSDDYKFLVMAVDQVIRNGAHTLIAGNSRIVAQTIVSQMAHVYGLQLPKKGLPKQ